MLVTRVMAERPWAEEDTVVHLISYEQIATCSVIDAVKDIVEAIGDAFI
jgi:hypothetical protein